MGIGDRQASVSSSDSPRPGTGPLSASVDWGTVYLIGVGANYA